MCTTSEIFQALICWRGCCLTGPGNEDFRGMQQWMGWRLAQDLFAWHSTLSLQLSSQTFIWGVTETGEVGGVKRCWATAASTRSQARCQTLDVKPVQCLPGEADIFVYGGKTKRATVHWTAQPYYLVFISTSDFIRLTGFTSGWIYILLDL